MFAMIVLAGFLLLIVVLLACWARSRTTTEKGKGGRGIAWILYAIALGGVILFGVILLISLIAPSPR